MKYFIIVNNIQQGPFSIEELRQQNISSETLVWAEGMAEWAPAWQVEELRPLLYGSPHGSFSHTPPPPPIDSLANNITDQHTEVPLRGDKTIQESNVKKNSNPWKWIAIGVAVVLLIMAITNPSKDEHRMAIKENVVKGIDKALSGNNTDIFSKGLGMLGGVVAESMINSMLDNTLQYHNYVFFSTTSIETQKGNKTTSYGCFGKVMTVSEQRIDDMLSSAVTNSKTEGMPQAQEESTPSIREPFDDNGIHSSESTEDSTSFERKIGNAIMDHVGQQVKKQIKENTDSTTSHSISTVIDDAIRYLKAL